MNASDFDRAEAASALEARGAKVATMGAAINELRQQLRRAQDHRLAAVFLTLPAFEAAPDAEAWTIDLDAIADEPVALPTPESIASPELLFRWGLYLQDQLGGLGFTFYLREPREAIPADPAVAAWEASDRSTPCPPGSHGAPAVEAAIMVRRVDT